MCRLVGEEQWSVLTRPATTMSCQTVENMSACLMCVVLSVVGMMDRPG